GGSAYGGAVYFEDAQLSITGAGFGANQAVASAGGAGGASANRAGGNGGDGGFAAGGGLRALDTRSVNISKSAFASNYVQGGRGGSGGRGGAGNPEGYAGGHGGRG